MMTTPTGYTREDLLAAATARGFKASARLISDWVELGLLDRPTRRGLGRGRGSLATWPENQLQLFLQLLDQKRKGARRIPTLCNLPVGLWLHFGDEYVPLRQTRRALKTWATTSTTGTYASQRAARQSASDLIEWLSGGAVGPDQKGRLAKLLGQITYKIACGQPYDRSTLVDVVSEAIAAANPSAPAADLAAGFARGLAARVSALSRLDAIPDDLFDVARKNVALAELEYATRQPQLAQQPKVGHVFDARDWSQRLNQACSNLLTHLGYLLPANQAAEPDAETTDNQETPATAPTARGHGTGTLEVPDATPP
jgi:hypothetical protein